MLDALSDAVARARQNGGVYDSWTWNHAMTWQDHVTWDLWLVRVGDPLAWEPGTPESRFRRRVESMVADWEERNRRPGDPGESQKGENVSES